MDNIKVEIYRDNNPKAVRTISLSLNNGVLGMEEQDVGPLVEECFGDSDYERFLFDISAEAVSLVLGISPEKELINKLKDMFGKNNGYDEFREFLSINEIKYKSGSY